MTATNQRVGVFEDPVLSWRRFDAMPAELRRIYAAAPYMIHMGGAKKRVAVYAKVGASVDNMREAEIFYLCKLIQQSAAETYGHEHPDAQRSRLEGRARAALKSSATSGSRR